MKGKILTGFLSYFLFLSYIHPYLQSSNLVWMLFVAPAVLMLAGLTVAICYGRGTISAFVEFDWQWSFIAFALTAPVAALLNHSPIDAAAASLLALLIVVITTTRADPLRFMIVAFVFCILGSVVTYHLGINQFGYLPWQEAANPTFAGISRVSLFPYLSDSAFFSVLILIAAVILRRGYLLLIVPSGYFVYFSYSRTALVLLAAVALSEFLSRIRLRGSANFIVIVVFTIVAVGFADRIVPTAIAVEKYAFGTSILEARLTRRSVVPIDSAGNVVSAELWANHKDAKDPHLGGRAALWRDHLAAFASSPLIGVGRQGAINAIEKTAIDSSTSGTESFFTRILAEVGIVAVFIWIALWRLFVHFDREDNSFGRALTIALVVGGAIYGSSMVPYNFVFLFHVSLIAYALKISSPISAPTTVQHLSSLT